jgi:hypothetical protein
MSVLAYRKLRRINFGSKIEKVIYGKTGEKCTMRS